MTTSLVAEVDPMDANKFDAEVFELAVSLGESTCVNGRRGVLNPEIDSGHRGRWNNPGTVELVMRFINVGKT